MSEPTCYCGGKARPMCEECLTFADDRELGGPIRYDGRQEPKKAEVGTMAMYFPGYNEAREAVQKMELPRLLQQIDALYGRENLQYGDDVEAVRAEALEQIRREFTDTSSQEYEQVQFWTKVHAATKANGGW